MRLRSRTFIVNANGDGLDNVNSVLKDLIGNRGDYIRDINAVHIQDGVIQLTIHLNTAPQRAAYAYFPPPSSIINNQAVTSINHAAILSEKAVDPTSIQDGAFSFDGNAIAASKVRVDSGGHLITLDLSSYNTTTAGYHSIEIDSTKINYADGKPFVYSDVFGYSVSDQASPQKGQEIPYTESLSRRGEFVVESTVVGKGVIASNRIEEYLEDKGISLSRLIATTSVDIDRGLVYIIYVYFKKLEPHITATFPYVYSLSIANSAPQTISVVFSEEIDKDHATSTDGLVSVLQDYSTPSGVKADQISISQDNRVLRINTSTIFTGTGLYDLVIDGIKAADGTTMTAPFLFPLQVQPYKASVFSGSGIANVGNGLYQPDPNTVALQSADTTITVNTDSIQVGTISASNISAGQVVKSISDAGGGNILHDDIVFTNAGDVSLSFGGNTITVSGKIITGGSGISVDTSSDPTVLNVHIDDSSTSTDYLWSASKVSTELAGKANTTHYHVGEAITGGTISVNRIPIMVGATAVDPGSKGLVPAPAAGDDTKYLRGDGVWAAVAGGGGGGDMTKAVYDKNNDNVVDYAEALSGSNGIASGNEVRTHLDSSTAVHGIAGAVVGTSDTQTLSNKTFVNPHINDGAGSLDYIISGGTISANRVAALPVLTADDTFVFASHSQTLQNKTIDGTQNTLSNLRHGTEVDNPTSNVHGVVGNVVGTTDVQTLTNKTLTTPSISDFSSAQHDHSNSQNGGSFSINNLNNVNISTTTDGKLLYISGGNVVTDTDGSLTVELGAPANDQVLAYNTTQNKWVHATHVNKIIVGVTNLSGGVGMTADSSNTINVGINSNNVTFGVADPLSLADISASNSCSVGQMGDPGGGTLYVRGTSTNINIEYYDSGSGGPVTANGVNTTVTITDGDTITQHILTFAKGILIDYSTQTL